ncbi:MAG: 2-phospho-L-lactate guanylyltransferase [Pseudomonadota bacterium]
MALWVLIPVKRFSASKSRLAGLFDDDQRVRLAEAMLRDTLAVVGAVQGISGVALVTADPAAAKVGKAGGALILDDGASDLNGALTRGRQQLVSRMGFSSLLVLPTDLPALTRQDVETVIQAGKDPGSVVVVPDHDRDGTNALLVDPQSDMKFAFGPGSFARHVALAKEAGLESKTLTVPRMAWDFDNPPDLDQILRFAVGSWTSPLLSELTPKEGSVAEKAS